MISLVHLDLNTEPFLPADGGRTSIPHRFVAVEQDRAVGVLVVSERAEIDLVFVDPDFRRQGIARQLITQARTLYRHLGTDDRLSPQGVQLARALRLPLYAASSRRKATISQESVDADGVRVLANTQQLLARLH